VSIATTPGRLALFRSSAAAANSVQTDWTADTDRTDHRNSTDLPLPQLPFPLPSRNSASEPGTIRGDYCIELGRNVIHGSDAVESAQHEIGLWFPEGVTSYERCDKAWIYE